METDNKNLHELVQASIDSIEKHIESVEKLPIEEEYKKELSSVLIKLYESISAAKPILSHLDQVRNLVINPIQEGAEKAFNESNKWGILGLKVSIVSLLITVVFGLVGSKIPGLDMFFDDTSHSNKLKIIYDDLVCSSPKIKRILRPYESGNQNILYISGECFQTNNVQFSGVNLPTTILSESLLSIDTANALKTEKGNVVSVFNYNIDYKNGSNLITVPQRLDKESMTIYVERTLTDEQLSDYRASFELPISTSGIRTLWQSDELVQIGSEPKYFSGTLKPRDSYSKKFTINTKKDINDIYLLITASGIGPAGNDKDNTQYIAMTSIKINASAYELDKFWPFWGDDSATHRTATFSIPINREDVSNGENTIQLVAGRYADKEGNIRFDNSLFQSIRLVAKLEKENLTKP